MAKLPKIIFVKESSDTPPYLIASKDVIDMADLGDKAVVGVYTLTEMQEVEGVVNQKRIRNR